MRTRQKALQGKHGLSFSSVRTQHIIPSPYITLVPGNLKYTTSLEAIQDHFASCGQLIRHLLSCKNSDVYLAMPYLDPPPQIRLLTPKPKSPASTAKSKGCAFLEFSHRNALQQGLKLHGSTLEGRQINVELTAGGGGKSEKRVQKVQARNKHLLEERVRVPCCFHSTLTCLCRGICQKLFFFIESTGAKNDGDRGCC